MPITPVYGLKTVFYRVPPLTDVAQPRTPLTDSVARKKSSPNNIAEGATENF